jgi:DNA modification methylase
MAYGKFNFLEEKRANYGKVICLGKTFNNEDERKEYFRNELRKKLPELKKIEGFPIGEDEDIIALSDPPYYTACPNPWLNDFIEEWEKEKEKIPGRKKDFNVDEPYASDISEGKNNSVYTAHTYHTKVPHPAIMRYILHYTQPGDTILDIFAGTGMTGVAAQLCKNPDIETKNKIEQEWQKYFGIKPSWGERKTIIGDLSPLASFIAYNYNSNIDAEEFENTTQKIIEDIKNELTWMYETKHPDGRIGNINYTVWSEVFACGNCGSEIVYWESAVDELEGKIKDSFPCNMCKSIQNKKSLEPFYITIYDSVVSKSINQKKYIPALIHYTVESKSYLKKPDLEDRRLIEKIDSIKIENWFPIELMLEKGQRWGDTWRAGVHAGITHIHHFYTKRNLIALSLLYSRLSLKFKVLFTSMLNRSSRMVMTVMSNYFAQLNGKTVGGWAGKPMNGTLYVPSISTEVSVLESLGSRFKTLLKLQLIKKTFSDKYFIITTASATQLNIESNSIDYIFTDPPFGDNIMYSELNYIAEAWLQVKTNNKSEAIESKSQNKSLWDYQNLMTHCFDEYYRVLKPNKWMTVEFSNTSAAVWNGIQTALQRSGFIIANVAALDKKQGSIKAVTTTTAVKQDLIISCYKPSKEFNNKFQIENNEVSIWEFIKEHLEHLPIQIKNVEKRTAVVERSPRILYDRLITFYLMRGLPIPIDATDFQAGLRQKLEERDGMFFTKDQVVEYDQLYEENKEGQYVLVFDEIYSESDAVLWLRERLQKKPQTYQDIMPDFRKANRVNRKGEFVAELKTVLEENFIQEDKGKWRVPNMNEAKDREALRNKSLLKEFDKYKEELENPKTKKIKEVRVEALRAGFKMCWEKKDFKTIVNLGDKIPQNILLEDEQLLMFYDIAKDRI